MQRKRLPLRGLHGDINSGTWCVRRVIQNKETDTERASRARPSSKLDLESGFVAFHHKRPSFFLSLLALLPTMKSWLIKETLPSSSRLLPSSLFAIVIVVPEIPNEVTSFISGPRDRADCTDACVGRGRGGARGQKAQHFLQEGHLLAGMTIL